MISESQGFWGCHLSVGSMKAGNTGQGHLLNYFLLADSNFLIFRIFYDNVGFYNNSKCWQKAFYHNEKVQGFALIFKKLFPQQQ